MIADTNDALTHPASSERLLTWLMLALLSSRDPAFPTRPAATIDARAQTGRSPHRSPLTAREIEVLRLVTLGLTNGQIAAHLFLSRRTVDQHLASIYNRLGVSCRAAATRLAMLYDLCL
jgi:DNA-binding NarL/FixJ family response regulator